MAKYTGWGRGKGKQGARAFTRSEYNKSYIKKNIGGSYETYLQRRERLARNKTRKKRAVRRSSGSNGPLGLNFRF